MRHPWPRIIVVLASLSLPSGAGAQTLENLLSAEAPETLARAAREQGDPRRGAILFHQAYLACARCHAVGEDVGTSTLGPDLTKLDRKEATDAYLVEAVLVPSKAIRKGFEPVSLATADGGTITGLLVEE